MLGAEHLDVFRPPADRRAVRLREEAPAFRDFVHARFGRGIEPEGGEKLYISRSRLGPKRGKLLGEERAIVSDLASGGFETPQATSYLDEQEAVLSRMVDVIMLRTHEPEKLQELADEVGALVALAMRDGDAAMLTRCWRPRNTPAIWLTEGHRLPLRRSSPGRAILAARQRSPGDPPSVREDREMLQAKGYLTSIGRWNRNINGCAVPFWPDSSQEPAAFLCGARADELPEEQLESVTGPLLLARVRELEHRLGLSELRPL